MEICKAGLEKFPNDVSILTEMARLCEAMGNHGESVKHYRNVATEDTMNTEAIACIGLYHIYNNQPEIALTYYRFVWNSVAGFSLKYPTRLLAATRMSSTTQKAYNTKKHSVFTSYHQPPSSYFISSGTQNSAFNIQIFHSSCIKRSKVEIS